MSLLESVRSGLRGLFRRNTVEAELDDELRHYLSLAIEERIRAGMAPEAAERAARLELGSVAAAKEEARSAGWEVRLESLWNDLRYAARALWRTPGFLMVTAFTLALGIGATTAIFSAVHAVILRPLPYRDPVRLAMLWTDDPKRGLSEQETSIPTIQDWRAQSRAFSDIAVMSADNTVTIVGEAAAERTSSTFVGSGLFPLLGIEPELGRWFSAEDEMRREHVVILSHALWQRRFGGAADVLGKALVLDGDASALKGGPRTVRIIGVMPAGFYFPSQDAQLWEPLTTYWRLERESGDRFFNSWRVVARLAPGSSFAEARLDMNAIGQRLAGTYPSPNADFPGFGVTVVPLLDQVTGKNLQLALWVLLGSVVLVLLIACVNVANLQLARGAARERELAVRVSLGAGRGRLLRQLLTESLLVALLGGGLGIGFAAFAVRILRASAPVGIARLDETRLDGSVLLFALGLTLLTSIIFGLVPAWKLSRTDPGGSLKAGSQGASSGRDQRRIRNTLVTAECALAVVLLVGAGLLIRSALRLQAVDPGFDSSGVVLVRVAEAPDGARQSAQAVFGRRESELALLQHRLGGLPGVVSVGAVGNFLLQGNPDGSITIPNGQAGGGAATGQLASDAVDPGFFSTMGVPLRRGRFLARDDALTKLQLLFTQQGLEYRGAMDAVVVNEAFVRRFFAEEDPIGKRFYVGGPTKIFWHEIVGVVGDMHRQGLERKALPEYFGSNLGGTTDLVIRASADPLALALSIRREIRGISPSLMVLSINTVDGALGELNAQRRFQTALLTAFALLALSLAAVGIYGLLHYVVAQRTREIGVRLALGARGRDVLLFIVRQGMVLAAGGIAMGVVAALLFSRIMASLLFETGPIDPATFVAVPLVLGGCALAACYLPARRAAGIDPVRALKYE